MNAKRPTLQVLVTPSGLAELDPKQDFCIVVDVLRASTTIACALGAGATGIIPLETVEEVMRLAATLDRETVLLCGERGARRVEGFDLGNSPLEYTHEVVEGKTLVFSTTNGARALAALSGAKACIAASFVTLSACVRRAASEPSITIACAGSNGRFALEDFLCAGMLVQRITEDSPEERQLDDGARTALETFRAHPPDPLATLRETDHGQTLAGLGFEEDLVVASEIDRFDFVPCLRDGRLVAEDVPARA